MRTLLTLDHELFFGRRTGTVASTVLEPTQALLRVADGYGARALAPGASNLVRKLLLPSASVVSLDGYKASFLEAAAARHKARGLEDFVVIGHPKAMTPYSLQRLEAFLAGGSAGQVSTFAPYRQKKEAARPEALAV